MSCGRLTLVHFVPAHQGPWIYARSYKHLAPPERKPIAFIGEEFLSCR